MNAGPVHVSAYASMGRGISPLPMGEGTVRRALGIIQASLLPLGEGQDEGWYAPGMAPPHVFPRARTFPNFNSLPLRVPG